ncbi:MAG: hypothetical protein WBV82_04590 [Myxococcaceae bacterium]
MASGSNKVTICPQAFGERTCPDPDGLLRRNEASGDTTKIPDCDANGCYVDECVPPGSSPGASTADVEGQLSVRPPSRDWS